MALARWGFAVAALAFAVPGIAVAADLPAPVATKQAYAPGPATTDWFSTLGVVAEIGPAWPGAPFRDMTFWGWPIIDKHPPGTLPTFFGGRDSASITLIDLGPLKLGPAGKIIWTRREASWSQLSGLGDVPWAVQIGGFAEYWFVPWLRLRGELRQGFNGEHGLTGDIFLDAVGTYGPFRAAVGPRVTFQSQAAVNPYFSVSPTQSVLSGLPVYNVGGGFYSWGVGGQLDYFFNPQWSVYGLIEYERISGSAANSPIVTQRGDPNQYTFGLGVSYSFSMHPLW